MVRKKLSTIVVVQALVLMLVSLAWATPAAAQPRSGNDVVSVALGGLSNLADLTVDQALGWLQSLWAPSGGYSDPDGIVTPPQAHFRHFGRAAFTVTKRPK